MPNDDFVALFKQIGKMFAAHEKRCVVLHDEPHRYYLGTHEVRAKDGYRTWLGGVEIKKSYVSAHLMPVSTHPALLDEISPALRKRMQGKSCFNFKTVDAALLTELDALLRASVAQCAADGKL